MKQMTKLCMMGALLLGSTLTMQAQTQHGWRGPHRSGIYDETGLLKQWPAAGPQLLWETMELNDGYSSPVIVGDRLYITGMNEDKTEELFFAFTLDGKKLYSTVYSTPWTQTYPETRTTPAVENGKAYVISGSGDVACLNTADGSILWKVAGAEQFGRRTGAWGTSECPLIVDNKVLFQPGGDQTAIVALNKETGAVVWKSESLQEQSNYTSPLLITHNGKRQVVAVTQNSVIGVNPENGKIEWRFTDWGRTPGPDGRRGENISPNTPIFHNGEIFVSNGYDIGSFKLKLNADATGVELVWRNDDLDTHHGHQVLVDGVIYGSNWINNTSGNWVAVDWQTGKTLWENSWSGGKSKGSVIYCDGMLYTYDERRGFVGLVKPSREKYDVVSEFRITQGSGPFWAHPVINDGVLYIRHGNALMAYKVK